MMKFLKMVIIYLAVVPAFSHASIKSVHASNEFGSARVTISTDTQGSVIRQAVHFTSLANHSASSEYDAITNELTFKTRGVELSIRQADGAPVATIRIPRSNQRISWRRRSDGTAEVVENTITTGITDLRDLQALYADFANFRASAKIFDQNNSDIQASLNSCQEAVLINAASSFFGTLGYALACGGSIVTMTPLGAGVVCVGGGIWLVDQWETDFNDALAACEVQDAEK